jgi:hypothetical protein
MRFPFLDLTAAVLPRYADYLTFPETAAIRLYVISLRLGRITAPRTYRSSRDDEAATVLSTLAEVGALRKIRSNPGTGQSGEFCGRKSLIARPYVILDARGRFAIRIVLLARRNRSFLPAILPGHVL